MNYKKLAFGMAVMLLLLSLLPFIYTKKTNRNDIAVRALTKENADHNTVSVEYTDTYDTLSGNMANTESVSDMLSSETVL